MDIRFGRKIFYGGFGGVLAMAILFMAVAVYAQEPEPEKNIDPNDCASCHEEVVGQWTASEHGTENLLYGSMTDTPHTGRAALAAEVEGATCDSCHWLGEFSPSHPEMVMLTDMSPDLCADCHQKTVAEWENSTHGDEDIACVRCHNPHTTSIKAESVQALCYRCHSEETYHYNNTAHAQENLLCTDCHLGLEESVAETATGNVEVSQRQHTFHVDLNTCNRCHLETKHESDMSNMEVMTETAENSAESSPMPPSEQLLMSNLNLEPLSINPASVVLVWVAGVLLGLFLGPQIEGRLRSNGHPEEG